MRINKIMATVVLAVVVLGLAFSMRASQAQDEQSDDEVLLPINRDWFPEDRYPSSEWEGMLIPPGDLPVCQGLYPEWFDEDITNGIVNDRHPRADEMNAAPTCKMASVRMKDRPADDRGVRSRTPYNELRSRIDPESVRPSSTLQDPYYRYASNGLLCTPSPNPCSSWEKGLMMVFVIHSPYKPVITSGSYSNYHFSNRTHIGGVSNGYEVTCQDGVTVTPPNVSAGMWWGNHNDFTYYGSGMMIFWERFGTNNCHGYATGVVIDDTSGAILFRIEGSNFTSTGAKWTMYAWLNGQWTQIGYSNIIASTATYIESGLEVFSANANFSGISVPLNFMHKANIDGAGITNGPLPWHDEVLPSRYFAKSANYIDTPWGVYDANSWNWTSIAAKAN